MAKEKKNDPFIMTENDAKNAENEISTGSSGILCPKMNKTMEGECKVCDYIQTEIYPRWPGKENQDHPARKWAGKKKAKLNWFVCVAFPENPDKYVTLELGTKAGNQMIDGMKNKGWKDILHPDKGVGRMMQCTKKKGDSGYPEYSVSPELEKADWSVSKDVWKNVPDLSDIIGYIKRDEMREINHERLSSLMKMGETITFRLLPPKDLSEKGRHFWISGVYRHWGVSNDQIDGNTSINWKDTEEEEITDGGEIPTEPDTQMQLPSEEVEKPEPKENEEKPKCFGDVRFFNDGTPDEDGDVDESCVKDCTFFKKCGKEVMKKNK